jgi:CubicO group peptidase (beta-lactamase class C family)
MSQRMSKTGRFSAPRPLSILRWLGPALLVAAVAATACGGAEQAFRPQTADQRMSELDRIVQERVDTGRSTGIVAGMVFPDGSTRFVAYGDAGGGTLLDENSVFEIGSVTKTFTGTLLADMVERGEVSLTDPVDGLLPPDVSVPSSEGRQITLEDLATHTSGLPRNPSNLPSTNPGDPYAGYTVAQLYEFLDGYVLTRKPGSEMEYSNLGGGLLGHALALRTGVSYEELVRERILDPLQMTSTGISLTGDAATRFTSGHDGDGEVVSNFDMAALAPAGGLRSSLTDMLAYAAANLAPDENPLDKAMAAAQAPRTTAEGMQAGLSWDIHRTDSVDLRFHGGATGGFTSFIGLDRDRGTAIVVLSNSLSKDWSGKIDDIGFHLLDDRLTLEPTRQVTVAPEILERYVGVYDVDGTQVRVTQSPTGLSAELPDGKARLYPESETAFFVRVFDAQIDFKVDSKGTVTGALVQLDGEETTGDKIT